MTMLISACVSKKTLLSVSILSAFQAQITDHSNIIEHVFKRDRERKVGTREAIVGRVRGEKEHWDELRHMLLRMEMGHVVRDGCV